MHRMLRFIVVVGLAVAFCPSGAVAKMQPSASALDAIRVSGIDGDLGTAIAQLVSYVAAHPNDAVAARMLGDLYFRSGDLARAEAVWVAETRRNVDDRQTHQRLGTLYAAHGRLAEARSELVQSLPLREGLLQLIGLEQGAKALDAFVARLQRDARDYPDDPWTLALYATALEATHHAAEALPYYGRVIDLDLAPLATRCEARVSRAIDLLDLKRDNDAVGDLQACLRFDPDNYAALTMLGLVYLHPGSFEQARLLLEHAVAVQPDGAEALIDLGYLDDATGDPAAAASCYRRAIAGDPLRPEAYINLGYDLAARKNFDQAEAIYAAGLIASPGDARLHYMLGTVYRSEGKFASAQVQFESALSADETDIANAAREALATLPHALG